MFGLQLGRLGIAGSLWNERALWPQGASSPGMWIDPSYVASCFQDSAGTTSLSAIGTVLDSANPVGLILDRKAGATTLAGPGIHLRQATSAARPVASARKNLYTNTALAGGTGGGPGAWTAPTGWTAQSITGTASYSAGKVTFTCAAQRNIIAIVFNVLVGQRVVMSVTVESVSGTVALNNVLVASVGTATATDAQFYINGVAAAPSDPVSSGDRVSYYFMVTGAGTLNARVGLGCSGAATGAVTLKEPQYEFGGVATTYQPVVSDSSYTASGFPAYLKLDGVDDGLASATFAAGTLTSSMDCLIAVRRDSSAEMVLGLWDVGSVSYFGHAESGVAYQSFAACGTPTVWVDGVQLSGGTAVNADTVNTALTPGPFHILELRGLDLSAWVSLKYGAYPNYVPNCALGGIQLFASGQDANRDKARARMAAYFGVTLA